MLLELTEHHFVEVVDLSGKDQRRKRIRLANDVAIDTADLALDDLDLIELDFPTYKDGRAFSQARELRERIGFTGDIRATGDVLRDQVLYMARCGFTSFVVPDETYIGGLNEALSEFSYYYQPAASSPVSVWQLRRSTVQQICRIA